MTTLFDRGAYRIVENSKLDMAGVELLEEPYTGLVYTYGKVEFVDGKPELNFQRNIVRPTEGGDIDELNKDEELNQIMGDILVELITQQIEKENKDNEQRSIEGTD